MMQNTEPMSIRDVVNAIVPISRFNRGEAARIFDEVHARGVKVVLKDDLPVCVLVEPDRYEAMVDSLEDYALFFEAERRTKEAGGKTVSQDQILAELGISDAELHTAS